MSCGVPLDVRQTGDLQHRCLHDHEGHDCNCGLLATSRDLFPGLGHAFPDLARVPSAPAPWLSVGPPPARHSAAAADQLQDSVHDLLPRTTN